MSIYANYTSIFLGFENGVILDFLEKTGFLKIDFNYPQKLIKRLFLAFGFNSKILLVSQTSLYKIFFVHCMHVVCVVYLKKNTIFSFEK